DSNKTPHRLAVCKVRSVMLQVQMPGALRPHQPGKSEHKTTAQGLTTPEKMESLFNVPPFRASAYTAVTTSSDAATVPAAP
ncbi:TPA: hypothetical protein ACWUI5_005585, partial [Escherichia coli]